MRLATVALLALLVIALLLVTGCGSHSSPLPPTSTKVLAKFVSNNANNPTCSEVVIYDCGWMTLVDTTTGTVVADKIGMDEVQQFVNGSAQDAYELRVNIQVEPGQVLIAKTDATVNKEDN